MIFGLVRLILRGSLLPIAQPKFRSGEESTIVVCMHRRDESRHTPEQHKRWLRKKQEPDGRVENEAAYSTEGDVFRQQRDPDRRS